MRAAVNMIDSRARLRVDIGYRDYLMDPARVLIQDLCLLGLPEVIGRSKCGFRGLRRSRPLLPRRARGPALPFVMF